MFSPKISSGSQSTPASEPFRIAVTIARVYFRLKRSPVPYGPQPERHISRSHAIAGSQEGRDVAGLAVDGGDQRRGQQRRAEERDERAGDVDDDRESHVA